jgi:glycosyltransferase involved in cell wall biosynthesis
MLKALWLMVPNGARFATGANPESGILGSPLASVRLRAGVAAREWRTRGNENLFRVPEGRSGAGEFDPAAASICVATKFTADALPEPWLAACRDAKRSGCPVVVDISDYPFEKPPPVPGFYTEALTICDAVVVNSERMAEMIAPRTPRRVTVIEDAVLGDMQSPEFAPRERLELLWFGHPANLDYLEACFEGIARFSRGRRCRLTIVTAGGEAAAQWTHGIPARHANAFETQFIPWSLEAMPAAFRNCDLVLIPSDPADPFKAGASANRLAEALNAGRFAVASPLQSYQQFAGAAWLGPDLMQGIAWALAHPGEVVERIRRGQALVAERFAANAVGRRWRELFEDLVRARDR